MAELTGRPRAAVPAGRLPGRRRRQRPGRSAGLVLASAALGVEHAVISADPAPGGMFRRWPFFQRLLSWTKPYAPADRAGRAPTSATTGTASSPRSPSTARSSPSSWTGPPTSRRDRRWRRTSTAFAERAGIARPLRLPLDGDAPRGRARTATAFVVETTDGEYRCRPLVLAVGVAEPYTPPGARDGARPPLRRHPRRPRRTPASASSSSASRTPASSSPPGLLPWARRIIARLAVAGQAVGRHALAGRGPGPLRPAVRGPRPGRRRGHPRRRDRADRAGPGGAGFGRPDAPLGRRRRDRTSRSTR